MKGLANNHGAGGAEVAPRSGTWGVLIDGLSVMAVVAAMLPSSYFSNKHTSRKNWTWVGLERSVFS